MKSKKKLIGLVGVAAAVAVAPILCIENGPEAATAKK